MQRTENWTVRYNALKDFYNEHGHLNIKDWDGRFVDGIDLYQWMKNLRQRKRNNLLSEDKVNDLNTINFPWKTARTMTWDEKYTIAKKYYEKHGTIDVCSNVTLDDGYCLGAWVYTQRLNYREGKLTERQIQLLNKLEFDKFVNNKYDEKWNKNLEIAKRYYAEYGNINVDDGLIYENFNLGNWITNAINFYHQGKLPEYRKKQLEEMGIYWNRIGNKEFMWEKYYFQLKNFLKEHSIEELSTTEDMNSVYNWLDKQKYLIENNQLEEEKLNKLLDLDISLERRTKNKDNWEYNYQLAKEYYKKHGHLLMAKDYKMEDVNLGMWIYVQRMAYQGRGRWTITQDKIDRLNEIGMEWRNTMDGRWDYKLNILKEYLKNTNNPFPMSRDFVYKEIELGKWLYEVQDKIKNNKLKKNQIDDIKKILPNIEEVKIPTVKQMYRKEVKESEAELINKLKDHATNSQVVIEDISVDIGNMSASDRKWFFNFKSFSEYLKLNPEIPVNTNKLEKYNALLPGWLYKNINNYKTGTLRHFQKELLDSLNIDLQTIFPLNIELKWLSYYNLILELLESNDISSIFKKYPDLQKWYIHNFKKFQTDKLNLFRKEKFIDLMDKIDKS